MGARIETVSIGDVMPFQLGEVKMNPRDTGAKDMDGFIDDLAAQFRANKVRPGQPWFRPILWKDGGIYQIIDGECRYMAMKKIGTKRFEAEVYDDLDAAEAARAAAQAMMDTDLKRPLTAEERGRGIQTQIELDLDDEAIAASARIERKRIPRIRRGAARAGSVIDQMDADWMEAIGEAEEAGDSDLARALTAASSATWRSAMRALLARREAKVREAALREALAWAGVAVADGWDGGPGLRYVGAVYGAEDARGREWPEGAVAYVQGAGYASVYAPEPEADPEKERARAEQDAAWHRWTEAGRSRGGWLAANLAEVEPAKLIALLPTGSEIPVYADDVLAFLDEFEEADIPIGPAVTVAVFCALTENAPWEEGWREPDGEACRLFVKLTDAMEACGYEPPEAERELYRMCAAFLEGEADE